ncbi:unannotated protein [freshwater metagenome]|uniref:Unannotated protein n=1 Tax=freshwater metagenome TaxID=449393 RepID=A0A6J7R5Y4_9ZZZZ
MVCLNVGDNRRCRAEFQEGTVTLIGLDDKNVATAEVRIRARLV